MPSWGTHPSMKAAAPAPGFIGNCLSRFWRKIDPHRARYFPLGIPTRGARDHVARHVNSVSRFTRSSKLSNRTSPCSKRSVRGIRLHKLLRKGRASDYFKWQNGIPAEHRFRTARSEHLPVRGRLLCRAQSPFRESYYEPQVCLSLYSIWIGTSYSLNDRRGKTPPGTLFM